MTGTTLSSVKGTSTLVRPKFGPGMLLQADDLDSLTSYTRELSRLLFRSLFGCGVVCGLVVTPDEDKCGNLKLTVGAGLALGCSGDPIYVPKDQSITVGDCEAGDLPTPLWVLLCATSKCCAPRTASCGCDDDTPSSTPTRVRDCFEIRVVSKLPKCVCCEPPDKQDAGKDRQKAEVLAEGRAEPDRCPCGPTDGCYTDHYAGKCACCDDCSDGACDCKDCNCVVLAELTEDDGEWTADHCVRRFVRPIFMRDPECQLAPVEAKAADERAGELVGKRPGRQVQAAKRPRKAQPQA